MRPSLLLRDDRSQLRRPPPALVGLLLWLAAIAIGILAESTGPGWSDARHWIPDVTVGWTFVGCGLVGMHRRPQSRSGALLVATGVTWFFGNFAAPGGGVAASLAAHLLFLHRGVLIHLVLTYPSGRTRSWLTRCAIALGYGISVVTSVWQDAPATIVLGVVLVAVSARQHLQAIGRTRRAHVPALQASLALGIALTVEAAIRMTLPTSTGNEPLLLAYEAVLVAIAGGLCLGLVFAPWERVEIADFIVEVGEERSGTLRAELSRALGDPSLDISYWLAERQAFVDAEGRTVDLPEPAAQKAVTMIERDGERIAALVHDPAVLEDQGLVEAVSVAAQLAASNARLQAEVRARLDELLTSRRRIVEAADEERWRLAGRLHQGAERHLRELAEKLHSAFGSSRGDSTRERIQQAEAQLAQTLDELRELAQGLHPRVLGEVGLEGALAAVVQRASVPAEISVAVGKLPDPVEAAVYFVCSEAIANVIKYASASHVRISVSAERDRVTAAVEDDGIGGVELGRGSGLRGLRDRVEALGGTLGVRSPRGGGTSVVAEIPLQTAMAARR